MELILAAIASGGLVGAADQYMCLLIVAAAAKLGWIGLSPASQFVGSWWFIAVVALFWLLTVAPAYLTTLAPGVMNTVNTVVNFLSGFVVPVSSALIALTAAGVIADLDPEARNLLQTLRIFGGGGEVAATGYMVAGGGALLGTALTAMKGAAKPGLSAATGTLGHVSAPTYATAENAASFVVMVLGYALASISPWLLVLLLVLVLGATIALLAFGLSQLHKLTTTAGQFVRLSRASPAAGLTVLLEFLVWGTGWLVRGRWLRGLSMLGLWALYGLAWWGLFGLASLLPVLLVFFVPSSIMVFVMAGGSSARALMKQLEPQTARPAPAPA